MAVLLASGNPLGLRAMGRGGRTAVASYEQITRTLRQAFGPDHAALFAEPSQRPGTIDWYSDTDDGGKPVRLAAASPDRREQGLSRLEGLVADIEAKAAALLKSDRQDERILGDMLGQALEIPDEEAVFLIGGQPVLTFWGYVKDQGRPALSPIQALVRRRAAPPTAPSPVQAPEVAAALTVDPVEPDKAAEIRPGTPGLRLPAAALWSLLVLLLLTCGIELSRGCVLPRPGGLAGWLGDACPAGSDAGLADERARQTEFRARYDALVREAALARQSCPVGLPHNDEPAVDPIRDEPEPLRPIADPSPADQQMKLPPAKTGTIDFLEGCWRAHEGLTESNSGKDTGKALKVTYCFDKDGTGSQTIRYVDDNARCVGPLKAVWDGDVLTIDMGQAVCEGSHGQYSPAVDRCRSGDDGVARCDETEKGQSKPSFTAFPFSRASEPP